MNDPTRKDVPLVEGGQGRAGVDLEAEAKALTWFGAALLVVLAVVGVVA